MRTCAESLVAMLVTMSLVACGSGGSADDPVDGADAVEDVPDLVSDPQVDFGPDTASDTTSDPASDTTSDPPEDVSDVVPVPDLVPLSDQQDDASFQPHEIAILRSPTPLDVESPEVVTIAGLELPSIVIDESHMAFMVPNVDAGTYGFEATTAGAGIVGEIFVEPWVDVVAADGRPPRGIISSYMDEIILRVGETLTEIDDSTSDPALWSEVRTSVEAALIELDDELQGDLDDLSDDELRLAARLILLNGSLENPAAEKADTELCEGFTSFVYDKLKDTLQGVVLTLFFAEFAAIPGITTPVALVGSGLSLAYAIGSAASLLQGSLDWMNACFERGIDLGFSGPDMSGTLQLDANGWTSFTPSPYLELIPGADASPIDRALRYLNRARAALPDRFRDTIDLIITEDTEWGLESFEGFFVSDVSDPAVTVLVRSMTGALEIVFGVAEPAAREFQFTLSYSSGLCEGDCPPNGEPYTAVINGFVCPDAEPCEPGSPPSNCTVRIQAIAPYARIEVVECVEVPDCGWMWQTNLYDPPDGLGRVLPFAPGSLTGGGQSCDPAAYPSCLSTVREGNRIAFIADCVAEPHCPDFFWTVTLAECVSGVCHPEQAAVCGP